MKNIEVPFAPGDELYYVQVECDGAPGPAIAQIYKDENGIQEIQVGLDGAAGIVQEHSGKPEPAGGPWNCLTRSDAEDWLYGSHPGAIVLNKDGAPVKALYTGPGGTQAVIAFTGGLEGLSDLVHGTLWTMEPDAAGCVAVYDKTATKDGEGFSTFVRDGHGEPIDVIYGPFIIFGTELDPETNMRRLADIPATLLATAKGDGGKPDGPCAYDPDRWSGARSMTIKQLKAFLEQFPDDAVFCCCGTDGIWFHYAPETKCLSVDVEDLADLPEYEGREPAVLTEG